jgi:DNA invertase Pin-like site-specific DNA recombinase
MSNFRASGLFFMREIIAHYALVTARISKVKFGRKPKLSSSQIAHARQLIENGQRVQEVASLLSVGRVRIYRALQRLTV